MLSVDGMNKPDHQRITYGPHLTVKTLHQPAPCREGPPFPSLEPQTLLGCACCGPFPLVLIVTQLLTFQTYQLNQNLANQNQLKYIVSTGHSYSVLLR